MPRVDRAVLWNAQELGGPSGLPGRNYTSINFFTVVEVYAEQRRVDIQFAHSSSIERGVSYTSPILNHFSGIDFVPRKGDLGVVATTAAGGSIIIGFVAGGERSSNYPMATGDLFTKTSEMSGIKQDSVGNIVIQTESGATLFFGKTGKVILNASNLVVSDTAFEQSSGIGPNGEDLYFKQEFFSTGIEFNEVDYATLAGKIINKEEIVLKPRKPFMRIHVGKEENTFGAGYQSIDIFPSDGDKIYRIETLDEHGFPASSITFDDCGKIEIKASTLVIDAGSIIYK